MVKPEIVAVTPRGHLEHLDGVAAADGDTGGRAVDRDRTGRVREVQRHEILRESDRLRRGEDGRVEIDDTSVGARIGVSQIDHIAQVAREA